jgi:uncharacterized membrane protein YraQ (UPF0718 family)
MLVPLLTLPFRHPLVNLIAQGAIYVSTVLAAIYLLARYMLRDGSYALAGTLSAVAFLGLAPASWIFAISAATFYGVWLTLGLGGLVVAERRPDKLTPWWRWLIALGLLVLAHWVYLTTALLLGPLVVARFLVCGRGTKAPDARGDNGPPSTWASTFLRKIGRALTSELGGHLLLLGIAFAFGYLFHRLETIHHAGHTILGSLPVAKWPSTWLQLWNNQWRELTPHHWPYFLFGAAFAGLVQLSVPARRRQASVAGRAAMAVAIAATVYFLFIGTRRWVFMNDCCGRYAYPALFVFQEAFALFAVGLLTPTIRDRLSRHAYAPAAIGLLLAALINFHSPSVKKVHEDVAQTFGLGGRTADVLAAHCTHVAGDYWRVMPTVFHANLMLHEQGESRTVWGLTLPGGMETRARWRHMPLEQLRIAVPLEDQKIAETWLQILQLPPMVVVEKRPTIYVLRPATVVLREQQQKSANGAAISHREVRSRSSPDL